MSFFTQWLRQRSLSQRFTVVSFTIMVIGMVVIGWWVSQKIRTGVINETAGTTALYMDSFITPNIQELSYADRLTPEHIDNLDRLFQGTDFGRHIVAFKVWDETGRILFSNNPNLIGRVFPNEQEVVEAYKGVVVAQFTNLEDDENVEERINYSRLMQIYSPIRQDGTNQIIAVAEFYQTVESVESDISKAQRQSWAIVGLSMAAIYLLLLSFVRWTDRTIMRQKAALAEQVSQLKKLLARNDELNERVKRAAANSTELNERFLRRTSAELHDGPVQELGLAMLRLGRVMNNSQICLLNNPDSPCQLQLPEIQKSLERSMQEIRDISKGLGIPQLENMTLPEIIQRVAKAHERRTATEVTVNCQNLPDQANLSFKITLFRLIQEALNNSFHHADGQGQTIRVTYDQGVADISVSDAGPGFDPTQPIDWENHLGLAGMRERVESLGGEFQIKSEINRGTTVLARLMLPS